MQHVLWLEGTFQSQMEDTVYLIPYQGVQISDMWTEGKVTFITGQ